MEIDSVVVDDELENVAGLLCLDFNDVKMKVGKFISAGEIMIEAASKRALLAAYGCVELCIIVCSICSRSSRALL